VNLHDLFAVAARRAPDKAAVRLPAASADGGGGAVEWSYSELLRQAEGVAAGLRRRGVGRGDRVACWLGNGAEIVLLHLAALRLGAVLVPLNPAYRSRELGHILGDAAPRLLIAEAALLPAVETVPAERRASLDSVLAADAIEEMARGWSPGGADEAIPQASASPASPGREGAVSGPASNGLPAAAAPDSPWEPPAGGDDPALLLYTSGTTGASKGAIVTHNNLLATVTGLLAAWSWSAADTLLLALPLFHVHGLIVGLDCALAAGATVELRRRFDAEAVAGELAAGSASMFFGVPTMYVRLVEALRRLERGAISEMRLFCSGSAPLAPDTFTAFEELTGHRILERYGMTEAGMILSNPYLGPRVPGQVGGPLPGVSVRLAIPDDLAVTDPPSHGEGELLVRGANVFAGYWQAREKTAASFVQDASGRSWFRTGDLARQDPATGAYTLLGRRHELILCGGFNVYPREIEETLLAFPGVHEAAVVGRPHPEWGEVPVAFLVAAPDLDEPALLAFCKDQLAAFKTPRELRRLDALPRNALGKLQKHLLPS
jgi:malonyl-CoA/methylmalonyl-CoA synthetase